MALLTEIGESEGGEEQEQARDDWVRGRLLIGLWQGRGRIGRLGCWRGWGASGLRRR